MSHEGRALVDCFSASAASGVAWPGAMVVVSKSPVEAMASSEYQLRSIGVNESIDVLVNITCAFQCSGYGHNIEKEIDINIYFLRLQGNIFSNSHSPLRDSHKKRE